MSDDGKQLSLMMRLFRASAYLFGAVILLHLSVMLIAELWWVFLLAALPTASVLAACWWYRRRGDWD